MNRASHGDPTVLKPVRKHSDQSWKQTVQPYNSARRNCWWTERPAFGDSTNVWCAVAHQTLSEDDVTLFFIVNRVYFAKPTRWSAKDCRTRARYASDEDNSIAPAPHQSKRVGVQTSPPGLLSTQEHVGEEHQAGHHFDLYPPPLVAGARPPTVAYKGNALAPEVAFTLDRGGHRGY